MEGNFKINIHALHWTVNVLIVHQIQHVIVRDAVNPSFIILKITSPGKTPDTTTAVDGEAVVC